MELGEIHLVEKTGGKSGHYVRTRGRLCLMHTAANIHYLRLSVTDLCNLRCRYCMPDGAKKAGPRRYSDL